MPKVVLTTGGTGGHIFPALATAEALREKHSDIELLFIGATYGPEAELTARAGIPFKGLPGRGVLGRGLKALPALRDNLKAVVEAIGILRSFKPCVVAAFGSYAAFAPGLAATILRIPLLLHEQNAVAGMSNRVLSRFASSICVSLPKTTDLAKPGILTGNPVRQAIRHAADQRLAHGRRLLVLGGSQGAHALNMAMISMLPRLKNADIEILHQTGQKDYVETLNAYLAAGYPATAVQPFIDDMAATYAWADLALCRAGASTVAELCLAELPAILVPFPAAIHDHQTLNAKILATEGAAVLLPEPDLGKAEKLIIKLFEDPHQLGSMSRACARLATPGAAANVAREIIKLCKASA